MKDKIIIDIGKIMDEVFEATKDFGESFTENFRRGPWHWDEKMDYYPTHSYPPANVYLTKDKKLVFEFALAGFQEEDISLEFQGDYMVFSAKVLEEYKQEEEVTYFKRRLRLKDITEQKYYAPADKFNREEVKAVFKKGILRVTIPPKGVVEPEEGIKIVIEKEAE
ncbi:MAG: Hsp20/alpha crystallin family protein [Spirochaetales bacterium]|nr:Hsp20/alpha crystallin family protein [Spirochaetales bacterium]